MSPIAVEKASNGRALQSRGNAGMHTSDDQPVGNVGYETIGGIKFLAVFHYRNGGLSEVRLSRIGNKSCGTILNDLVKIYGHTARGTGGLIEMLVWDDFDRGDGVWFTKIGGRFGPAHCEVSYQSLDHDPQRIPIRPANPRKYDHSLGF